MGHRGPIIVISKWPPLPTGSSSNSTTTTGIQTIDGILKCLHNSFVLATTDRTGGVDQPAADGNQLEGLQ